MNILFCDNSLSQFLNFRGQVVEYFHNMGYDVSVIVPETGYEVSTRHKIHDYLKIYKVKMNPNSSNPLKDFLYLKELYKLFRSIRPNIIFTYTIKPNIYGAIVAKMLNIPIIAMVPGLGYTFSGNSIKHKLGRFLYKFGLRKANKVIVLNESNYKTLLENKFSTKEKLIIFKGGEGVNLDKFPFYEDDYESLQFLMVARILYDKGYTEFIEAAKIVKQKYPDIKFELLGPLSEDSPMSVPFEIIKRDQDSGIITYLGETDNVKEYLGRDGVVVVLISSYGEGLNRSLMEACAMGRICITSDIPGCIDVISDNYNGFIVSPKKPEQVAQKIFNLIETPAIKRKQLANNAKIRANEIFDIHHVLKKYSEIVNEIL